tara:strand:- start:3981 stop:5915 length:1935 start_codon:yes stop_codon:yes gene_type:complete
MTHLNELSKIYRESIAESAVPGKPAEKLGAVTGIPKADQMSAAERIKKKTAAKRAALEKKHGTKPGGMDDHPEYKKKKYVDEADMKGAPSIKDAKPANKTNVKYDPHMKVMAPQKEEVEVDEAMSSYDRNRKRAAQRAADRNAARAAGKTGVVPGVGYVSPRKERETYVDSAGTTRHKSGAKMESLDPVGKEDGDVDNDGDKDSSDKYLMKRRKAIGRAIGKKKVGSQSEETEVDECWKTHKKVGMKMKGGKLVNDCRPKTASDYKEAVEVPSKDLKKLAAKAVKRVDTDVDGDVDHNDKKKGPMGEFVPSADGKKRVYSGVKEGFSNWRNDLVEVIKDEEKTIKEKSVKNKIIINPELKESVENLGGVLLEVTEFSSILEEITDAELEFLSDSMIEEIVEEVFAEALEDGDDIDVMETLLCESIEASLTLLQEDAGAEARKRLMSKSPRASKLDRIKSAVKKGAQAARKAVVKGSEVAGKAVGHAKNLAKDMGSAAKKGYKSTQSSSDSSSDGETRKPQAYRNQGVTKKKPGMLSRIGSKLKSGLKKAVGKTARAVSRGARNVARRVGEETELQEKELSIADQMRISREAAAKRKPYQPGDREKQRAAQMRNAAKKAKKDTRTDAQKMTDATGPRPGSRYRGD